MLCLRPVHEPELFAYGYGSYVRQLGKDRRIMWHRLC